MCQSRSQVYPHRLIHQLVCKIICLPLGRNICSGGLPDQVPLLTHFSNIRQS
jgi:hypothetical protein